MQVLQIEGHLFSQNRGSWLNSLLRPLSIHGKGNFTCMCVLSSLHAIRSCNFFSQTKSAFQTLTNFCRLFVVLPRRIAQKTVIKVSVNGEKEKRGVLKAVAKLKGMRSCSSQANHSRKVWNEYGIRVLVNHIGIGCIAHGEWWYECVGINELSVDVEKGTLTVIGDADPVCIITCLRKKCGRCAEIDTVGPPKSPEKPETKCPSPCQLPPCPPCRLPPCSPCRPYPYSSWGEYDTNTCSILWWTLNYRFVSPESILRLKHKRLYVHLILVPDLGLLLWDCVFLGLFSCSHITCVNKRCHSDLFLFFYLFTQISLILVASLINRMIS